MFISNMDETQETLSAMVPHLSANQKLVIDMSLKTKSKKGLPFLKPEVTLDMPVSLSAIDDHMHMFQYALGQLAGNGMKMLGAEREQMYSDVNHQYFEFSLQANVEVVTLH